MMRLSMLSAMYLLDQVCDYYYSGSINISQSTPDPFALNGGIGYSLIYLGAETFVYLGLAIVLDYITNDIKVKKWFSRHDVGVQRSIDVDDDPRALYFTQTRNGRFVRMALISTLLEGLYED